MSKAKCKKRDFKTRESDLIRALVNIVSRAQHEAWASERTDFPNLRVLTVEEIMQAIKEALVK